ncbi:TPA: PerC family transcriptional regulator [Citrobacter freundii]|nr:PerC family transcriptional regulator [Citrobacter freundii]
MKVNNAIAEKLENAGLWRRAAARWLVVMHQVKSDEQRTWISERRGWCLSRSALPRHSDKLDIVAINRSATKTQEMMGIRQPVGIEFRSYPDRRNK